MQGRRLSAYVGLLRAINVGGAGTLLMRDLVAHCPAAGFETVRTFIANGNVVFTTALDRDTAKAALAVRLLAHAGTPVGLRLRDGEELEAVLAENPFTLTRPARIVVIVLDAPPPADRLDRLRGARRRSRSVAAKSMCLTARAWAARG